MAVTGAAPAAEPPGFSRICPPTGQTLPVYPGCQPAIPMPAQPTAPQVPTPTPPNPLQLPENPTAPATPPSPAAAANDFASLTPDSGLALGGGDVALTPNLMGDAPGVLSQSPLSVLTANLVTPGGQVIVTNPNGIPTTGIPGTPATGPAGIPTTDPNRNPTGTPATNPTSTPASTPTTPPRVPTVVTNPATGVTQQVVNTTRGPVLVTTTPATATTPPQQTMTPLPARSNLEQVIVKIPQFYRGAFKITENESPRPRTRAYFSYYYYDQLFASLNPANTPRMMLHQQVFGYEQAFLDSRFSVGIRLPYNQLVSTGFYNYTGLGDLTLVTKSVLYDNREAGLFLSGGLVVTAPTADNPIQSGLGATRYHSTLLQPYLGYIVTRSDFFFQGFSAVIVPTDDNEATIITNDWALGYFAYRRPGRTISAIIPAAELHINSPTNQPGLTNQPTQYFQNVTALGTIQTWMCDKATVGFSCGAPITGPRPFSIQAGLQMNWFF